MNHRGLARETDVGAAARIHFTDLGWIVYAEVADIGLLGRPDLVAVRRPLVLIAECKTRMSLHLLDQVSRYVGSAHYVIACAPYSRASSAKRYLKDHGIGWLFGGEWVVEPKLHRTAGVGWISRLRPEQVDWCEPGSAGGGYWTPFAATCAAIREYVQQHPGASTKAVIEGVKHHYRTDPAARSALYEWAKVGKIRGIEVREGAWWPVVFRVPTMAAGAP